MSPPLPMPAVFTGFSPKPAVIPASRRLLFFESTISTSMVISGTVRSIAPTNCRSEAICRLVPETIRLFCSAKAPICISAFKASGISSGTFSTVR